jgi:hypothetical protein
MTLGEKLIRFNSRLDFTGILPPGILVMNPFRDNPGVNHVSSVFYKKYFSDNNPRHLILGINPGRFGAGTTGIPFTDTKRLNEDCGIAFSDFKTHEPSSAFIYEMIDAYGGVIPFYNRFLISAICPLGFTKPGKNAAVNFNYYDSKELTEAVTPFILDSLEKQLSFGIDPSVCFCLGTGKNESFLRKLNEKHRFFGQIIALEHPRFIMQYRARRKKEFIWKYVSSLGFRL